MKKGESEEKSINKSEHTPRKYFKKCFTLQANADKMYIYLHTTNRLDFKNWWRGQK